MSEARLILPGLENRQTTLKEMKPIGPRLKPVPIFWLGLCLCSGCNSSTKPTDVTVAASPKTNQIAAPPIPTEAQGRLQTIKLWIGPEQMNTELALTGIQLQTGMMFRTNIAENEGMLFVFPYPHQTAFWMKNTLIPLSAAYIDPEGVILEIHNFQPHDTNSVVASSDRIQYVLETPQGWFERHHIGTNTLIRTEHGKLSESFTRR
jgi:uncharacterized membrane protein (UPF0127 family)